MPGSSYQFHLSFLILCTYSFDFSALQDHRVLFCFVLLSHFKFSLLSCKVRILLVLIQLWHHLTGVFLHLFSPLLALQSELSSTFHLLYLLCLNILDRYVSLIRLWTSWESGMNQSLCVVEKQHIKLSS